MTYKSPFDIVKKLWYGRYQIREQLPGLSLDVEETMGKVPRTSSVGRSGGKIKREASLTSHGGKKSTTGGAVRQADIGKTGIQKQSSSSGGPHFGHMPTSYDGAKGGGAKQSSAKGIGGGGTGGPTFSFLPGAGSYSNGRSSK